MGPARGEARWLVLDDAHVPALGSEAVSFDHGGQAVLALDEPYTALMPLAFHHFALPENPMFDEG